MGARNQKQTDDAVTLSMFDELLNIAWKILKNHKLCDNCLGRQFANLASGTTNADRGRALKIMLLMTGHRLILREDKRGGQLLGVLSSNGFLEAATITLRKIGVETSDIPEKACELCKGKLQEVDNTAREIRDMLTDYEYETFLIGARISASIVEAEDRLRAKFGIKWGETIKSEFTREIGKFLTAYTGKNVDYKQPDVVATVDPFLEKISVQINPLFISGRYRKLVEGLSQTLWLCSKCQGRGCEACQSTGKKYPESVQEIVATPILAMSSGVEHAIHAAGGEDIDAKVLGRGRPFILEIKNPKKRRIPLDEVAAMVNTSGKVQVEDLRFSSKEELRRLKASTTSEKVYVATVESDGELSKSMLLELQKKMTGNYIQQKTAKHIIPGRRDRIREIYIYRTRIKRLSARTFEMHIWCEGGLHVKELINGDEGRTEPSVSKLLNRNLKCISLAVLNDEESLKK